MIYVTVGKMPLGFERLVKAADELAALPGYEVFIQAGSSSYRPVNAAFSDYLTLPESEGRIAAADVVVSHAGFGTIISAMRSGTPIVIVPRRKGLGEHFNDHQMEIAKAVEGRPGVEALYDAAGLEGAVKRLMGLKGTLNPRERGAGIISAIEGFLEKACK